MAQHWHTYNIPAAIRAKLANTYSLFGGNTTSFLRGGWTTGRAGLSWTRCWGALCQEVKVSHVCKYVPHWPDAWFTRSPGSKVALKLARATMPKVTWLVQRAQLFRFFEPCICESTRLKRLWLPELLLGLFRNQSLMKHGVKPTIWGGGRAESTHNSPAHFKYFTRARVYAWVGKFMTVVDLDKQLPGQL